MPPASRKRSASPYGLHDLHAIAFVQLVLCMLAARNDFTIHFHRDAALAVSGSFEQQGDRCGRAAFVRLAVKENLHA